MAIGLFWLLNIGVALASLALLVGLLYVYGRNLRDLRSPLTLGLVAFGVVFVVQNVLAIGMYVMMAEALNLGANVAMPMLVLNVAGLAGFASLFYVTWR